MSKAQAIVMLTLIMIGMFACVAVVYRDEIEDTQAYTRRNLLPDLPTREDLAP